MKQLHPSVATTTEATEDLVESNTALSQDEELAAEVTQAKATSEVEATASLDEDLMFEFIASRCP